jgi:hypothetical protein
MVGSRLYLHLSWRLVLTKSLESGVPKTALPSPFLKAT